MGIEEAKATLSYQGIRWKPNPCKLILGKTKSKRYIVWNKYNKICFYCGAELKNISECSLDHFIPKANGGTSRIENLRASCNSCNHAKKDHDAAYFFKSKWLKRKINNQI